MVPRVPARDPYCRNTLSCHATLTLPPGAEGVHIHSLYLEGGREARQDGRRGMTEEESMTGREGWSPNVYVGGEV